MFKDSKKSFGEKRFNKSASSSSFGASPRPSSRSTGGAARSESSASGERNFRKEGGFGERRPYGKPSFGGFKKASNYGSGEKRSFGDRDRSSSDQSGTSSERSSATPRDFNGGRSAESGRSFGGERSFQGERSSSGYGSERRSSFGGERRGFGGGRSGGGYGGGFGGSRGGNRRPMQKSRRVQGTNIDIKMLINKVNDEAFIKPTEHVLEHQFADFKIEQKLKDNITKKGYISPTPIQDQAIPVGLEGKDVIGLANTGTGKTAAFLIPLINKMLIDRNQKAIILTPTRELAVQIQDELRDFAIGFNLNAILCIGGSNITAQARMLKSPFSFIIGTPGRVMDLMNRKWLYLDRFQNVVLDEADRMVDMGFINDMKLILGKLPKQRQSMFFTATLDHTVEALIGQFLTNPVKVSVKTRDTSVNIEQDVVHVPNDKEGKMKILVELLSQKGFDKVLVFGRTKFGVEKVSRGLLASGVKADSIHGDKSQNYRLKALQRFKRGEVQVLCATDVAARGLDINGVSHVINFDVPATYDDYVHRIGRTGRADKKGVALTFVQGKQ